MLCLASYSQEHAWVYFKDKPSEANYFAAPLTMLSQRALNRRIIQNISLDSKDIPIEIAYYQELQTVSEITILAKSKWLNAIHVLGEVADINNLLTDFDFIERIDFANKTFNINVNIEKIDFSNDALNINTNTKGLTKKTIQAQHKFKESISDIDYGNATNQIEMLKGDVLHNKGFTGQGMHIAVMDAGFPNVNTLNAFSRIRDNNQILGGYDFVDRSENFYSGGSHGTNVLSDIAAYLEGEFVGTAPDASFYLFRTEESARETPLEESLWVEAAERADSLGVDIINTSLGYTTFDNSNYDYSYDDMDGTTTFITRGAEIGASKGMLLVNSAVNSGNNPWNYIGAPADAVSVFSIGAVNANEGIASFSSFGPTIDGRVKPDVLAQGQSSYVVDHISGQIRTSSGTSFSSPIIAGVIACFWQAFPDKTNFEIMQIIRESADRYSNPTSQHGYGIPDFELAYDTTLSVNEIEVNPIRIYPNPAVDILNIEIPKNDLIEFSVIVYNVLGEKIYEKKLLNTLQLDVSLLNSGVYFLKILNGKDENNAKIIINRN